MVVLTDRRMVWRSASLSTLWVRQKRYLEGPSTLVHIFPMLKERNFEAHTHIRGKWSEWKCQMSIVYNTFSVVDLGDYKEFQIFSRYRYKIIF